VISRNILFIFVFANLKLNQEITLCVIRRLRLFILRKYEVHNEVQVRKADIPTFGNVSQYRVVK